MIATTSEIGSSSRSPQALPQGQEAPLTQAAAYDAVLVRRFKAGDEAAFVEIAVRYRTKMFSVALSHLRNPADAEEIAQDTLVCAHRGLSRFRGDSSLSTWLYRIAFNLSRNRHKHNFSRRQHLTLSLDSPSNEGSDTTFLDSIPSDAPNPARKAAAEEFSERVERCMAGLSVDQRDILTLRTVLNESYSDIATLLGINIGTVKSRIGRARENLRALLGEIYPELASASSIFAHLEPIRPCGGFAVALA